MDAEQSIEKEERILVTPREWARIQELLENPPPMNDKLKALLEEYKTRPANGSREM